MDDKLLHFIGEIYEAAWNPDHWDSVMEQLCELIGARSGGINVEDHLHGGRYMIGTHGMPAMAKLSYRLGLAKYDHIFQIQAKRPVAEAALVARHDEMKTVNPLYYRFIMKPNNMGYVAAISFFNDKEWHAGIGIHRGFESEPFGETALRMLDRLAPHFQRALRIQRELQRLKSRAARLDAALSRLMLGVMVINERRELVYRNAVADAVIEQHPALTLSGNRLRLYRREEHEQLEGLMSRALEGFINGAAPGQLAMGAHHPEREHPLLLMLAPMSELAPDFVPDGDGRAVIYLSEPGADFALPGETLRQLFGLTDAEAGIAVALANGLSLKAIAERNGVSQETVRSQLKGVFSKTGTGKQQELLRLLLRTGIQSD